MDKTGEYFGGFKQANQDNYDSMVHLGWSWKWDSDSLNHKDNLYFRFDQHLSSKKVKSYLA